MRVARYLFGTAIVVLLTVVSGCKPREEPAPSTSAVVSPDAAAAREALTRGMTEAAFTGLSRDNIGDSCVVVARTPEGARREPPPPPLGMVYLMGPTTVYKGEIHDISPESLDIGAVYPTSGNRKIIQIPRDDIESVYLDR